MRDYTDLVKRLNEYSAEHEMHGGITAEAADAIEELCREIDTDNDAMTAMYGAMMANDAVPVVRCKDCRYCCKEDDWTMWCTSASPAFLTTPEDYCSHGRRRDAEG